MFINIPNNFASLHEDLIFEYSSTTEKDITAKIIERGSQSYYGVKRFNNSKGFSVNTTPLIFERMLPCPVRTTTSGFEEIQGVGFPEVQVLAGIEHSDVRRFTYAKRGLTAPMLMSTMPAEQILFAHETLSLWSISSPEHHAKYEVYGLPNGGDGYILLDTFEDPDQKDCAIFHLLADEYNKVYCALRINLIDGESIVATLNIALSQESSQGYRIAWISSAGGIEHYTFPMTLEESYTSEGKHRKTLRSAYGCRREIEALSEIISSERVWRVTHGEYTPLKILSTEQNISKQGALSIVTLKIEEND